MASEVYLVSLLIISCPLIFLTIVGNSFLLITCIFQRSIRKPQYGYFFSLGIADFLVGIFIYPITVAYIYQQQWIYGLTTCRIYLILLFSLNTITAWHLVAIAVDRYRIITEGVTYVHRRSMRSIVQVAGCIWLVGFWVVLPIILDWDHVAGDKTGNMHCVIKKSPNWVVHSTFSIVVFPGALLVIIYLKIYKEIQIKLERKYQRQSLHKSLPDSTEVSLSADDDLELDIESSSRSDDNAKQSQDRKKRVNTKSAEIIAREKRTASTLIIVTGAFLACLTPWCVVTFYDMTVPSEWQTPYYVRYWLAIIAFTNSCMNPIIYAFRIPEFQIAFKRMIKLQIEF